MNDADFSAIERYGPSHHYSVVNISGNAKPILGDIYDAKRSFFSNVHEDDRRKALLRALYYDGMRSRKAQIDAQASSPRSIEWIWSTNFVEWLRAPESFFWITGRPGSGKSTLMKHVSESRKTINTLESGGQKWIVLNYFFDFRAGFDLPNRIDGMLRSLLHQLAMRIETIAESIESGALDLFEKEISLQQCLDMLCDAVKTTSNHICAFIDGLDEFMGPASEILETIHALEDRTGIKICLASRPEPMFKEELSRFPSLALQDHNDGSIRFYTEYALKNAKLGLWAKFPRSLAKGVEQKANGIFLWARLAVDELVCGLLNGNSDEELESVLQMLPTEVEAMYQRILDNIPLFLKAEAAILLHMIMDASAKTTVRELFVALQAVISKCGLTEIRETVDADDDIESRLLASLGSLVDLPLQDDDSLKFIVKESKLQRWMHTRVSVRLIHETVKVFLLSSDFLLKNLPVNYRRQYPDLPWIRLYSEEITQCSHAAKEKFGWNEKDTYTFMSRAIQVAINSNVLETLNKRGAQLLFTLKDWPVWTSVLADAIQYLSHLIRRTTTEAQKIFPVVRDALCDSFFLVHVAINLTCGWPHFARIRCTNDWVSSRRMDPYACAFELSLLGMPTLALQFACHVEESKSTAQSLFDRLFELNSTGLCDQMEVLQTLVSKGACIGRENLRNLLDDMTSQPTDRKLTEVVKCIPRRNNKGGLRIDRSVEDEFSYGIHCLTSWANLKFDDGRGYSALSVYEFYLSCILEWTQNVNQICGENGTVLHYVLKAELSKDRIIFNLQRCAVREKFIVLVHHGIDPLINGKCGSALTFILERIEELEFDHAQNRMKESSQDVHQAELEGYSSEDARIARQIAEDSKIMDQIEMEDQLKAAQLIRDILQYYIDHESQWPTNIEERLLGEAPVASF